MTLTKDDWNDAIKKMPKHVVGQTGFVWAFGKQHECILDAWNYGIKKFKLEIPK